MHRGLIRQQDMRSSTFERGRRSGLARDWSGATAGGIMAATLRCLGLALIPGVLGHRDLSAGPKAFDHHTVAHEDPRDD